MRLQLGRSCLAHGARLGLLHPLCDTVFAEYVTTESGHGTGPAAQTDRTGRSTV